LIIYIVPGRLPSQLPSGETIVYGILSKHSKISSEVTLKGILVDREVRLFTNMLFMLRFLLASKVYNRTRLHVQSVSFNLKIHSIL